MATCKECIHYKLCLSNSIAYGFEMKVCSKFENKSKIELEAIDDFKNDVMNRFIDMCGGNDYNKINLLQIGDTIDHIFELHIEKRNGG